MHLNLYKSVDFDVLLVVEACTI